MKSFLTLISFFIVTSASAADINQGFEKIRTQARYYKDPGAVCEEIARTEFQAQYPAPQYEVIVGVAYNWKGRTIGELDMVLMDKNLNKVVMVGEVKCYTNFHSGLSKAKQQRKRFLSHLGSGKPLHFVNTSTGEIYDSSKFQYVQEFISISQKGGRQAGFDYEMEYSLDEMSQIRDKMIECQRAQQCPIK